MDPQVLAYLPFVTPVATLIVVIMGVLFSNRHVDVRIGDLRAYIDARFEAVNGRFSDMEKLNETRMALLLGKIEDIDNRLARLEERFAR